MGMTASWVLETTDPLSGRSVRLCTTAFDFRVSLSPDVGSATAHRLGTALPHPDNQRAGQKKGSGTKSAKHPLDRSGFWFLTPFSR